MTCRYPRCGKIVPPQRGCNRAKAVYCCPGHRANDWTRRRFKEGWVAQERAPKPNSPNLALGLDIACSCGTTLRHELKGCELVDWCPTCRTSRGVPRRAA